MCLKPIFLLGVCQQVFPFQFNETGNSVVEMEVLQILGRRDRWRSFDITMPMRITT